MNNLAHNTPDNNNTPQHTALEVFNDAARRATIAKDDAKLGKSATNEFSWAVFFLVMEKEANKEAYEAAKKSVSKTKEHTGEYNSLKGSFSRAEQVANHIMQGFDIVLVDKKNNTKEVINLETLEGCHAAYQPDYAVSTLYAEVKRVNAANEAFLALEKEVNSRAVSALVAEHKQPIAVIAAKLGAEFNDKLAEAKANAKAAIEAEKEAASSYDAALAMLDKLTPDELNKLNEAIMEKLTA